MHFLRKFLSFTLENLNGKFDFLTIFLPFSRIPGAVGEFFAFYFSLLWLGGWGIFRLVWNSGGLGRETLPRVKVWLSLGS